MHEGIHRAYGARWLARETLNLGVPVENLLAGTGLEESWIHDETSRISYEQYCRLVENALLESQEPSLGLTIGKKFHLGEFGLYGYRPEENVTSATIDDGKPPNKLPRSMIA